MSPTPMHPRDALSPTAVAPTTAARGPDADGLRRRLACRAVLAALAGGAPLGLIGCGGGDEDPATADVPQRLPQRGVDSGGTGALMAAVISAPIDAVNPVTVNGIAFDTSASSITDADGEVLGADALQPGMTCLIEGLTPRLGGGNPAQATAQRIRVGEQLLGPVGTVAPTDSSFSVFGQRVVVTAGTVFDSRLAAGLGAVQPGMVLRIWGQLDSAGARIVATRVAAVDAAAAPAAYVLRGVLTGLDRASGRVTIGGWTATAAAGDSGAIAADLALGDTVRARLAITASEPGSVLQSLRQDALQLPERAEAEVEGRVTALVSARSFAVDGVSVDAASASWTPSAAALALGARVTVQGRVGGGGVLLARSVSIEPDEPVELEGSISAADAQRQTFVLRGVTVAWSGSTRFVGGSARLLSPRRRVAVVGRWNADRTRLVALRIHVEA